MPYLNVSSIINDTRVEGPNLRTAIWLQGCLKRCKKCCNPNLLPIRPANLMDTVKLFDILKENKENYNIEGITILGGEPLLQIKGLTEICSYAKSLGLSVIIFTGYSFLELNENNFPDIKKLMNYCDVIIDGEFDEQNIDNSRNWVGSTNQNFNYLSNIYDHTIEITTEEFTNEIRLDHNKLTINGLPFKLKIK